MKARFNIDGKQLEVIAINYHADEMSSVTIVDESGNYLTYYDKEYGSYVESALKVELKKSIEFPEVQETIDNKINNLIHHLDEMYEIESGLLTDLAIDAMEDNAGLPFAEVSLLNSQKEYKLMQQRVFGILDTIEGVKAFQEGWFSRPQQMKEGEIKNG
ncbi:hypothetical protein [Sporosarcina sp. A2]|uniref:hypothetical protein n=1 Tax=Sporosarcina sp. A2 TaxID=3393449 RepID=UPI003D791810